MKDGGTIAVAIPKKAVDVTKRAAEGTAELVKNAGLGVGAGIKKGAEVVREKAPVVGGAIAGAAQKTGAAIKTSAKKTADWSRENMPKAVRNVKGFTQSAFERISSAFKKKQHKL